MNPFAIVLNRLWEILEANPVIAEKIRPGNRIKFLDELGDKKTVVHGDLPEIVLVPVSFSQPSMGTSGTGELSATFKFFISTNTKNVNAIFDLEWELFRALNTFMAETRRFEYNENRFVTLIKMESGAQAEDRNERNQNIIGWEAGWGFRVDMSFPNSELIYKVEGA